MFNLSGSEVLFILVIGLVVLGPEKLPQMLRRAGRLYGELRRLSQGVQSELKSALDEPTRELRSTTSMAKRIITGDEAPTTIPPAATEQAPNGTEPRFIPYPGPYAPGADEAASDSDGHSKGSQSAAHTDDAANNTADGAPVDDRGVQDPPRHD